MVTDSKATLRRSDGSPEQPRKKNKKIIASPPTDPDAKHKPQQRLTPSKRTKSTSVSSTAKRQKVEEGRDVAVRRPRWVSEDLLRDVIIGYIADTEEDPKQSGIIANRQSNEISTLASTGKEIPITKDRRNGYVWVAAARAGPKRGVGGQQPAHGHDQNRAKKYTWNLEEMQSLEHYELLEDQICDVCGRACTDLLYEFRCYRRQRPGSTRQMGERRLHPFVSYISKECGRGLLGVQSEASKLREHLYRVVSEESQSAVEILKALWRNATASMRRVITEELRHFARTEAGESQKAVEIRKAEAVHGTLHPVSLDPFRCTARAMAPFFSVRDVAGASIQYGIENHVPLDTGILSSVKSSLQQRLPLPYAPAPCAKADITKCLQLLTLAWPLRVELLDMLTGSETFEPKREAVATLKFIYLPGCGQLHVQTGQKLEKKVLLALRVQTAEILKTCREAFSSMESLIGRKGCSKAQDRAIEVPDGEVSKDLVTEALQHITWPNCFTRNNVRPEGAPFINAFPLGIVLNYALGLVCSRPTKLWPNLTKLLTKLIAQEYPDFQYTTIQLNKDYPAKMHVDGNNHGPSYIIGLGDYQGGELWTLDEEEGLVPMEVPCTLRGWGSLRPGQTAQGRLMDCKNRWVKFDGNRPHATMPFTGNRISIVFFTRKGWLRMRPEATEFLQSLQFALPGEDYEMDSTLATDGSVVKGGTMVPSSTNVAPGPEEDDEIDEDEQVDAIMREEQASQVWAANDWASVFRARLGVQWGKETTEAERSLCITCCNTGPSSSAFALQELLNGARLQVTAVSDNSQHALKFLRRNCAIQHAFSDIKDLSQGKGHCEVHHRTCRLHANTQDDILIGRFQSAPFLNMDASKAKQSCFDDPRAVPFVELRRVVEKRHPRVAVLETTDMDGWDASLKTQVLKFLLDGTHPRSGEAWGLRLVKGYAVSIAELRQSDFGVPLAGTVVLFVLVREDCGGQKAADGATGLTRALSGTLPSSAFADLVFEEDDPRLLEARRTSWKKPDKLHETAAAKGAMMKAFAQEAKEIRIKPGEAPYCDFLGKSLGDKHPDWFPHASPNQITYLNLVYERAQQSGTDLNDLIVDLSQSIRQRPWRDDGLLPASSTEPMYYSFFQHRPLIGQELLMCHGFPAWRLGFQGISDTQMLGFASSSAAVPVIGAALCGALAIVDFGEGCHFRADPNHIANLIALAPALQDISAELPIDEAVKTDDAEEAQFEGRAAALLNLVSHGAFAEDDGEDKQVDEAAPAKQMTKAIQATLSKVAQDEEEDEITAKEAEPVEGEPRDWPARLRELRTATSRNAIESWGWNSALRWVNEAAEDPKADLSPDIVKEGIEQICQRMVSLQKVPQEVSAYRQQLLYNLRDAGKEAEATQFNQAFLTARFLQELEEGSPRLSLDAQTPTSMPKYVNNMLSRVAAFPMQRGFLEHLARTCEKGWSTEAFANSRGFELISTWLHDAPAELEKSWPHAASTLQILYEVAPDNQHCVLSALLAAAGKLSDGELRAKISQKIESSMVKRVCHDMHDAQAVQRALRSTPASLHEFSRIHDARGDRFKATAQLLDCARTALKAIKDKGTDIRAASEWKTIMSSFNEGVDLTSSAGKNVHGDHWTKLSMFDAKVANPVQSKLEVALREAEDREAKEHQAAADRDALRALKDKVDALCSLVVQGHLRDATTDGLLKLLAKVQEVGKAASIVKEGDSKQSAIEAAKIGELAAQRYCELPERLARARRWLRQHGLGCCCDLLHTHNLLECLYELPSHISEDAPELPRAWKNAALPKRVREALVSAVFDGDLRQQDLEILENEVPPGWRRVYSQSTGFYYFKEVEERGRAQWQWPTEHDELDRIEEPPEPKKIGTPVHNQARYIEFDRSGIKHCLLCHAQGESHFRHAEHYKAVGQWRELSSQLHASRNDFQDALGLCDANKSFQDKFINGLTVAWFGNLCRTILHLEIPPAIVQTFWHCSVKPDLPATSSLSAIMEAYRRMLAKAYAEEENLDIVPVLATVAPVTPPEDDVGLQAEDEACRNLHGLLTSDGFLLRNDFKACSALMEAIQRLQGLKPKCSSTKNADIARAIMAGKLAMRRYCERPGRHAQAKRWLARAGFAHCTRLLESFSLLDRLLDVATDTRHTRGVGLPPRCLHALSTATCDGRLIPEDLLPAPLPTGWERKRSESIGLHYFQKGSGSSAQKQWEWPVEEEAPEESKPEPPCPPGLTSIPTGARDTPEFVISGTGGELQCLLCSATGNEHLNSDLHRDRSASWQVLANKIVKLKEDLQQQLGPNPRLHAKCHGLHPAWRGELLVVCQDALAANQSQVPENETVAATFWHCTVKPRIDALKADHCTMGGLLDCLSNIAAGAQTTRSKTNVGLGRVPTCPPSKRDSQGASRRIK